MAASYVDLMFQGHARVIATAVLRGPGGIVLVDPGPTTCLPALEAGLAAIGAGLRDVDAILLTHIHLDHAGACGSIVARVPGARVFVHERGARHMIDPERLLASATRLYGDQMDVLWGAFEAVPASRVTALAGGERLDLAGRAIRVAYTPGHAVHHVSYLDETEGIAYVGDTCGIRINGDYTIAATPPPDIDLEAWGASLDLIEAWQPAALFLTHFGPVTAAKAHVAGYRRVLATTGDVVARSLSAGGSDAVLAAAFAAEMREAARHLVPDADARALELAAPFEQIWAGMARYWRKRAERAAAST